MCLILIFKLVQLLFVSTAAWCSNNCYIGPTLSDNQKQLFIDANIPNDISEDAVPPTLLSIKYGGNIVKTGEFLSPTQTLSAPNVDWDCDENQKYILIMVDPDATGTAKGTQLLHWRVDNINDCDVNKGQIIAPYLPPTPPPESGNHRYYLAIILNNNQENSGAIVAIVKGVAERVDFNTDQFIQEQGCPVAANFFNETVDVLPGKTNILRVKL